PDAVLFVLLRAQDLGVVAIGKVSQAADRDHYVHQRHLLAVWQGLGLRRFADDADLFAVRTVEAGDDHGDYRVADVLRQTLLDIARELRGIPAEHRQILDEGHRHFAIRTDRNGRREILVAPEDDVDGVERSDEVVVGRRRR